MVELKVFILLLVIESQNEIQLQLILLSTKFFIWSLPFSVLFKSIRATSSGKTTPVAKFTKTSVEVKRTNTKTYGDRAFSVAGPKLWNELPIEIKNSNNVDSFKRKLKTHLFKAAFYI